MDGPHGGIRNVSGSDEQFLMFNVSNFPALRDNLRQSAAELTLLPAALSSMQGPGRDDCASDRLDVDTLALVGHSMGASIAPLTLAVIPDFDAAVLSGAGGSWIENIVHKQLPLEVRPLAEAMLGYGEGELTEHDPALALLQWAGEPADVPVFARRMRSEEPADLALAPPHTLMIQGIVDHYILPPIANAASLSLGLDLVGEALDAEHPELAGYRDLGGLLPLVGGAALAAAEGNRVYAGAPRTMAVAQHAEDGVEDGHEVMFQVDAAKARYRCFLETLAASGLPLVGGACEP